MNRIEYQNYLQDNINRLKESVNYINQEYIGLNRDIHLCLVNLHFAGFRKTN